MTRPVCIVTGGRQGLGHAVCFRLATEWDLAIFDLQDAASVASDLCRQGAEGQRCTARAYSLDIANRDAVMETVETVRRDFSGPLRGVVNCAGIVSRAKPGEGNDEDELRMFRVNVLGAQHLVDAAAPALIASGGGSIVTISSMAGRMGADAAAESYTGSKADLIGRSKQWAKFYGPQGIRCNVVAPGPIKTEMLNSWSEEQRQSFINKTPLRRIAEPEDVANVVWFLLSEQSRHVTGVSLDVNGGYYIG